LRRSSGAEKITISLWLHSYFFCCGGYFLSNFCTVLVGALSVAWRGKKLKDDPEYQKRIASGQTAPPQQAQKLPDAAIAKARGSTLLFLAGIGIVVLIGMFQGIRPMYQTVANGEVDTDQVVMGFAIMIIMLTIAGSDNHPFQADCLSD
jgi:anaerobic C4-dicarboxylate transporter